MTSSTPYQMIQPLQQTMTSSVPSYQPIQPLHPTMQAYPTQQYHSYPNVQPMQQHVIRPGRNLY